MPTFLDTAYVVAQFDRRDQFHSRALSLRARVASGNLVTTEAVLVEIGNALSTRDRAAATAFVRGALHSPLIRVVPVDTGLLREGLAMYSSRPDKRWGLTDCISFAVMVREGITDALTSDRHFVQAGFRALMLEEP